MSLFTEAGIATFDARQVVGNAVSSFGDWISSAFNGAVEEVGSLMRGGVNVIGINVNEIPNMRAAIRTYCDGIAKHLDQVNTTADTSGAYKGEYAAAITQYVAAIVTACKAITSNLLAFSDQLKVIQDAYTAQNADLASKIKGTAAAAESQATNYQEKY